MVKLKQGDIIKLNFDPQSGHEQAGYRPALVVSNDVYNQKTNLVIVCPISNTPNDFPLHVKLDSRTVTTGSILCQHIKALDVISRGMQLLNICRMIYSRKFLIYFTVRSKFCPKAENDTSA